VDDFRPPESNRPFVYKITPLIVDIPPVNVDSLWDQWLPTFYDLPRYLIPFRVRLAIAPPRLDVAAGPCRAEPIVASSLSPLRPLPLFLLSVGRWLLYRDERSAVGLWLLLACLK